MHNSDHRIPTMELEAERERVFKNLGEHPGFRGGGNLKQKEVGLNQVLQLNQSIALKKILQCKVMRTRLKLACMQQVLTALPSTHQLEGGECLGRKNISSMLSALSICIIS